MNKLVLITVITCLTQICTALELSLPSIFADKMVLQREQSIPIWGSAAPGSEVEVSFAGQSQKTITSEDRQWQVELKALKACSQSRTMIITATLDKGQSRISYSDVLVGEVWLCGGQSNMYRPFRILMSKAREPKYEPVAEYLRQEAANANDPLFRQYRVGRDFSVFKKQNKGKGKWSKAISGEVNEFCGTAYFFGKELRQKLGVPVALISCNVGGTKVEPWIPSSAYQTNDTLSTFYESEIATYKKLLSTWNPAQEQQKYENNLLRWKIEEDKSKRAGTNPPRKPRKPEHPSRNKQIPSTLYNGMVSPLVPFAMKGAIWYQGESNTGNSPNEYAMRLGSMIEGWRAAWGQKRFFFLYCQLASYKDPSETPLATTEGWVEVSNQQRLLLKLRDTGMAVLNDIGEAKDIHPKNKVDAGKRLSLWALKKAYGQDIVYSGPLYKSSQIKGNRIIIKFTNTGSGLMTGSKHLLDDTIQTEDPLQGFQICGDDREWKWANANIIGKNRVEVFHEEIPHPVEVRYAWAPNPVQANLYNKEGLPTSLFKTKEDETTSLWKD